MALATVVYWREMRRLRDPGRRRGGALRGAAARVTQERPCPRSTASTWPPASPSRGSSPACGRSPTWSATAARSTSTPPPGRCTRTSRPASPPSTWPITTARPSSSPAAPARTRAKAASTCSCSPSGCRRPVRSPPPPSAPRSSGRCERLRVPAIDLLQFHAWNYADPSWLDALFHLHDLQREGLIRFLGLTNVDAVAPAAGAHQRHSGGVEPGQRVAHRPPGLRRAGRRVPGVRRVAARLRHVVRRLAQRSLAGRRRARLGASGDVVADEVRPLHSRRRRLAGAAARAPGGARTSPTVTACRLPTWRRGS